MKSKIYSSINEIGKLKLSKTRLKLIMYSVLIGILTGFVVVGYRLSIDKLVDLRNILINNGKTSYVVLVLFFLGAIFIQTMLKLFPLISGSGIPQVMALLKKIVVFNWFFELVSKFIGGVIGIFMGMSLGREGPSIHLGSLIADGVGKLSKSKEVERKYLITAGASAGLAAAFNAPLSGTIFAVEELHKFFSPLLLICSIIASICSNFVTQYFLGRAVVFNTFDFSVPFSDSIKPILLEVFLILGLSIIMAIAGKLFNYFLSKFQDIYAGIKVNSYIKMLVFAFFLFFVVKLLPDITGGGHFLIEKLVLGHFAFKMLLIILICKFFFTMICYSSGTPGGIFLPLLVIGAIIGKVYGIGVSYLFGLPHIYTVHFVLLAMAAYFAAIVRSPITGIVLVLELTGNFSNLFSLTVASAMTYIISEILTKTEPVYEMLFNRMCNKAKKEEAVHNVKEEMTAFRIPIVSGSKIVGKCIKDISWPENLLIIGIERNNIEFIPKGNTKMYDGDKIIVFTDSKTAIIELEKIFDITLKEDID